jgi:hypothetical protein
MICEQIEAFLKSYGRVTLGTISLGTGGTYKEGQIILQGDHIEDVKKLLIKKGFDERSIEVLG